MDDRPALADMLKGGDRRSIGRANEVAREVLADPALVAELVDGLDSRDPVVRMRAADAMEKVSAERAEWLQAHCERLLEHAVATCQQEVQWHAAQILARLDLSQGQLRRTVDLLRRYLAASPSRIVRASALEALADLADRHPRLRAKIRRLAEEALESGVPSLAARARKVLRRRTLIVPPT
jgi:HEAT repeat protein